MPREPVDRRPIWRVQDDRRIRTEDWVAVEEPLEIRVAGESLAIIMRTPGHDLELAAGFALTEGVVRSIHEIGAMRQCQSDDGTALNVVEITLSDGTAWDAGRLHRNLISSAACGLCGRASLEALATRASPCRSPLRVPRRVLETLPDRLSGMQAAFGRTGALHAAALFDAEGSAVVCREDVGRHNAVDKVVGRMGLDAADLSGNVLLVSGRTSFEILQKAAVAGIPVVCAISGPTTLAIDTAEAFNITLVNFLRGRAMNIATCPERITGD
jgi:FdhD protein